MLSTSENVLFPVHNHLLTTGADDSTLYYVWFKYDLGQKYYAPQVQPDQGSNSRPPDHCQSASEGDN